MIVEYTRYRIPEDRRTAFIEAYGKAAEYLKASPDCVAYELAQCAEEADRFILRIEWNPFRNISKATGRVLVLRTFSNSSNPSFMTSRKCSTMNRRALLTAFFCFSSLSPSTALSQQRPAFQPFRYDEDWSVFADASLHTDALDSLKYIRLGPAAWFVTLGGEARERFERLDQPGFGVGPVDQNGYSLQRYLLSADFHFGQRFRFFTELQSGLENGRNGGPRPTDADTLDMHQAFVDWNLFSGREDSVTLRVGRQEIGFGSGRLISAAEGLNLRRSLDGARLIVKTGKLLWNATALRLVRTNPGIFDDSPDHTQTYWGVGVVAPHPIWRGANFSLHYHGLARKNVVFEKGVGRAIRETVGLRTWKAIESWEFNYEGFIQWGSFRGAPIRAWALAEETGYTVVHARLRPRLGIRADIASGDRGQSTRTLGSFDPLFPAAPVYSGPSGLLGPTNLIDLTPTVRLRSSSSVTWTLESSTFWRESLDDGVYGPSIAPIRMGHPNEGRYVATAPSATIAWQANHHLSTTLIFTHFFTGGFFRNALPDRNVNYLAASLFYRF